MQNLDFEYAQITKNYLGTDKWNDKILSADKIILFGAGYVGAEFADTLINYFNIYPLAFCDNKKVKGKDPKFGIDIIPFDEFMEKHSGAYVAIASTLYHKEMFNQLHEVKFCGEIIPHQFFFEVKHLDGYKRAFDIFRDDISKQIVIDKIDNIINCTDMKIYNDNMPQYFNDNFIELSDDEVFVEGGVCDGRNTLQFIERCQNYRCIYGFEPDAANFKKCQNNLAGKRDIELFEAGLWSESTTLRFSARGDASSRISDFDNQAVEVPVVKLDDIFYGKPKEDLPTFIKMDIEGSEKEALIGCSNIIRTVKPILAICAYHKMEDFYELPKTILQINPAYKLFLRHYTTGRDESVIYAV